MLKEKAQMPLHSIILFNLCIQIGVVFAGDNLALLSATLRTYQRAGCDQEQITLNCPRGTSISIDLAQYGSTDNSNPHICPMTTANPISNVVVDSGTEVEIRTPETCDWPKALQYSLLQTVVEACQKKRHCKFLALPNSFQGDPCPGKQKFVEVAYKCRPYEFRSKVACENDVIQLVCNPYSRVAIYSASYGRTEHDSLQCAQPQGVKEESKSCLASYATETVMQICHGRRRCSLTAGSSTFGRPCKADSRVYLKVVYTCVPRKVLKDRYDSSPEPDEPQQTDLEQDQDDLYDDDQFYRENEAIPPAPKLLGGPSKNRLLEGSTLTPFSGFDMPGRSRDDHNLEVWMDGKEKKDEERIENQAIGFIAEWMNAYIFISQNQERFYLYLIISVTAAVLLCLFLVIGRLVVQRRRANAEQDGSGGGGDTKYEQSNTGETTLPSGFSDDISEIDADIDLTTPIPTGVHSISKNEPISYPTYTPSPSPYGNLGPSNISHTSTTLLVPPPQMMTSHPPNIISGANPLMLQAGMHHPYGMGTIARHSTGGPIVSMGPQSYMQGSMIGHMATLRRQPVTSTVGVFTDVEGMPKSLVRGGGPGNTQFYYG